MLSFFATLVLEKLQSDSKWVAPLHMNNSFIDSLNELRESGYLRYGDYDRQRIPQNSIINRDLIVILKNLENTED
jgi:hypothetical protein